MVPAEMPAAPMEAVPARRYGTICVVGGGCYGTYYVRQLQRARERQAIEFERLLVIDRNAACAVASAAVPGVALVVAEWAPFFAGWFLECGAADAIVPSPLMPHLLLHWLESRARERWPERGVTVSAPGPIAGVPWQRQGGDGSRYVSFAEWMCPVNCIEPRICPHTRDVRTWSMPVALSRHASAAQPATEQVDAVAVLHCTHRAYGVGMIDARDILAADETVARSAHHAPARVLVGTVSHCHGALGVLSIT